VLYNLIPYDKYITMTDKGFTLSKDAPQAVVDKIDKINSEYRSNYGEILIYKEG